MVIPTTRFNPSHASSNWKPFLWDQQGIEGQELGSRTGISEDDLRILETQSKCP